MSLSCSSCATFSLTGYTHTVVLRKPLWHGVENKITKEINRFPFWSDNYTVHDDGISSQPLILSGIETISCAEESGFCFSETETGACFPLCFNTKFTNKFKFLDEMAEDTNVIIDRHEEVTISGLGTYLDGVYVIKSFSYSTIKKAVSAYSWTLVLEKVR